MFQMKNKGNKSAAEGNNSSLPKLLVRQGTSSPASIGVAAQKVRSSHEKLPKFGDSFSWTASRDLPASYRFIEEDNKVLQETLKKLKHRGLEQDATLFAQIRQVAALKEEITRLQQALKDCSVSPKAIMHHKQFNRELQQRDSQIGQLREKVRILEKARDSLERKHRGEKLVQHKQCEAHAREVSHMKDILAEKDREVRITKLYTRTLHQRLEVLEAGMREVQQKPLLRAISGPLLPPPPQEQVQVMLCFVYDAQPPSGAELREWARLLAVEDAYEELVAQRQSTAALLIQTFFRAFKARRLLRDHRHAAIKIQAHIRAMLARRALAALRARACVEAHGGGRGERRPSWMRHSLRSQRKGFTATDTMDIDCPRRMSGVVAVASEAQAAHERRAFRRQSSVLNLTESAQAKRVFIAGTASQQRAEYPQFVRITSPVPRLALAHSPTPRK